MMDHSSESWFSTGVPVSAIRAEAGSPRTARACAVAWFLIACASSQTTRAQRHLAERRPVPGRDPVRGDDEVRAGQSGGELAASEPVRPVMDVHPQVAA